MDDNQPRSGSVTRERLLEAAGEIFAEQGLHGTKIRDITQRAGANIAAVNYHFKDKFHLYAVALRRAHESVLVATEIPLTEKTPKGRVRQLLSAILTASLDPARPKWQTQLVGRELVEPTPALDLMEAHVRPLTDRLREAVRDVRPDLSEQQLMLAVSGLAARCIFHVYHAHLVRRMFPDVPQPDVETLVAHVGDYSLAALQGLPSSPAPKRPGRRGTRKRSARAGKRK